MATDRWGSISAFSHWCEAALRQLAINLMGLGYEFENEAGPLGFTESDALVEALEERFGELPAAYRAFYQTFCFVDFRQAGHQLHSQGSEVSGLGLNCPLVFEPLYKIDGMRAELAECGVPIESEGRCFLPTGGSASNCEPKGVWVPSRVLDPVLFDEGAGPVSLIEEVRDAILAGGFPFWMSLLRRSRHTSPLGFSPPYAELLPRLLRGIEQPPPISAA
jgi:hypothetical protein